MSDYEIIQREIEFTTFKAAQYADIAEQMHTFVKVKGLYEGDVIGMHIEQDYDNHNWVGTLLHAGKVVDDDHDDDDVQHDTEEKQTPTLSENYIRVKN